MLMLKNMSVYLFYVIVHLASWISLNCLVAGVVFFYQKWQEYKPIPVDISQLSEEHKEALAELLHKEGYPMMIDELPKYKAK